MKIKIKDFKVQDLEEILSEISEGENYEGITLIQEGEWIGGGKYENKELIFKFEDKFYSWGQSRTRSYFTEYENYDDDFIIEVEPKEKTIIEYVPIK